MARARAVSVWACVALPVGLAACRRAPPEETATAPPVAASARAREPAPPAEPPPPGPRALPDVPTDWCLEGWRGLDEATCWLVPDGWDCRPRSRLLVYLSGIVPPVPRSPQKEKVQRVVAAAAARAGAVALLPRGLRGIGPSRAKDWWAWPTSPRSYDAHASAIVAALKDARAALEAALGRFDCVYLAGSSSGAYFLTALALSGAVDMDGYAATSGGSPGRAARRDAGHVTKRPFYVGYASGDATRRGPKALAAFLSAAGWPVRVAEHPGGHGAREVYLDEAFAFWEASEQDAGL